MNQAGSANFQPARKLITCTRRNLGSVSLWRFMNDGSDH